MSRIPSYRGKIWGNLPCVRHLTSDSIKVKVAVKNKSLNRVISPENRRISWKRIFKGTDHPFARISPVLALNA